MPKSSPPTKPKKPANKKDKIGKKDNKTFLEHAKHALLGVRLAFALLPCVFRFLCSE